mmetsp:Transcript_74609/g.199017  ORF Transcript_74609/g.199017 Transcript_74609/m.199017 type:complete len:250 (+) Transcript_74609:1546-2295(+)
MFRSRHTKLALKDILVRLQLLPQRLLPVQLLQQHSMGLLCVLELSQQVALGRVQQLIALLLLAKPLVELLEVLPQLLQLDVVRVVPELEVAELLPGDAQLFLQVLAVALFLFEPSHQHALLGADLVLLHLSLVQRMAHSGQVALQPRLFVPLLFDSHITVVDQRLQHAGLRLQAVVLLPQPSYLLIQSYLRLGPLSRLQPKIPQVLLQVPVQALTAVMLVAERPKVRQGLLQRGGFLEPLHALAIEIRA